MGCHILQRKTIAYLTEYKIFLENLSDYESLTIFLPSLLDHSPL